MKTNYTICDGYDLRTMCMHNKWFTCGSNEQYKKLFYANEHNATVEEIATIIWLCSTNECSKMEIEEALREKAEYYQWQKECDCEECYNGSFDS